MEGAFNLSDVLVPLLDFPIGNLVFAISVSIQKLQKTCQEITTEIQIYGKKRNAHGLTKLLSAVVIIHEGTDIFLRSIRFDDLVLSFQPLLVLLSVLKFYRVVPLNPLYQLGLYQPGLQIAKEIK